MGKDLTVVLENRPGTLAEAAEALGRAGINISGACGFPAGGEGILHICLEGGAEGRRVLEQAGFQVRDERDVLVTDIEDHPGALGQLARRVAEAGVNVDLVYLTADGRLVLGADDLDGAKRALGRA